MKTMQNLLQFQVNKFFQKQRILYINIYFQKHGEE